MPSKFVCQVCGYESPKWLGRCPVCGSWNSFKEVKETKRSKKSRSRGEKYDRGWVDGSQNSPLLLSEVEIREEVRIPTGIGELDRVLGGGVVSAGFYIIGGDPGIGKSTLVLQIADRLVKHGYRVLYATAEESLPQLKLRAQRLGARIDSLFAMASSDVTEILDNAAELKPHLLIVDSIQTVYMPDIPSVPGSVSQVRECGAMLLRFSKSTGAAVMAVGHVTKDGTLAGPRTLEHMVDAILFLEGDRNSGLRILRAIKNRYGSTEEIGVFEMAYKGLIEVKNPSELFISDVHVDNKIGVTIIPLLEGNRPILVEAQALVSPTPFSMPIRNTTGFDARRLSMLLAVIENHTGVMLRNADVFVNLTGGMKADEPGADLGVALAIISSFKKEPLPGDAVYIGEIGLTGEIRPVKGLRLRLQEARRLGFKKAYIPTKERLEGIETVTVKNLSEIFSVLL